MKKDNKDTQTFISRMPVQMHKELRFIAMYTGQKMGDIGNYAISQEIERFKKQIPALKDMSDAHRKAKTVTKIHDKDVGIKVVENILEKPIADKNPEYTDNESMMVEDMDDKARFLYEEGKKLNQQSDAEPIFPLDSDIGKKVIKKMLGVKEESNDEDMKKD